MNDVTMHYCIFVMGSQPLEIHGKNNETHINVNNADLWDLVLGLLFSFFLNPPGFAMHRFYFFNLKILTFNEAWPQVPSKYQLHRCQTLPSPQAAGSWKAGRRPLPAAQGECRAGTQLRRPWLVRTYQCI